jgi:hypothetical protein
MVIWKLKYWFQTTLQYYTSTKGRYLSVEAMNCFHIAHKSKTADIYKYTETPWMSKTGYKKKPTEI